MIESFRDKRAAAVRARRLAKGFPADVAWIVRREPRMLDAATRLDNLRTPPGNRLEALKDDRAGQHSIRVDDQWRVCFVWRDGGAHEVEVVDYHRRSRSAGPRRTGRGGEDDRHPRRGGAHGLL